MRSVPPRTGAIPKSRKAKPCKAWSAAWPSYGAFVDVGGVDALLHVADISWGRVNKPSDALAVGQQIEAKVLRWTSPSGALPSA